MIKPGNLMLLESESLSPTAKVRLYEVDMSAFNGGIFHFYSGLNEKEENLFWKGLEYDAFPSKIDGIQRNSSGASSRPTFILSNITGVITGLFVNYNEMVGAVVKVTDVYAKFLDPINFKSGFNPNYDPNQEMVTYYRIQKAGSINKQYATFELALPMEADNAMIPSNIITTNNCQWIYRGIGCRYSGNNWFNAKDEPVTDIKLDVCSKTENGCIKRFGENNTIPIRIFPSCDKVGK